MHVTRTNPRSNALHQYLAANLNISVRGEPSDEIWKHRPPFHPSFRDFLEEQCRKPTGWVGLVVTVRHPLAWLLSQTSDGHHSYAHQCVHRAGSRVCVFGSCHISNFRIDTCPHVRRPGKYSFPTLLDLWASYASHLPTRLPTVLVTRYEELLRDPEAVLQAVSKHFGIAIQRSGIDPLRSYSRKWDAKPSSSGVVESRGRLTSFEDFWGQFGVSVTGRNASSPSSDRQTGGNNPVSCPPGDRNYLLLNPSNAGTLRSALDRNVLSRPLAIHNYMVPTADDASTAWETCKLRTAADRVIPLGYPTVVAEASKLPGSAAADEILDTLRNRCAHYFHGMKPAQLAVVGLPNSGSDALHRFLQDNLDMPVEPELPGLWKHLPVFHKRFQMDLLQKCLMQSSSSWTGIIFVVRHPLAWLQEQSKSGHEVGQTCIPNGMGDVECFFETCDRGKAPGCAGKPHRYITPHLLHLWGAYVDHLPSGLPPFLVVRYEDLLRDSDAVLREVVNHFKLEAKPAGSRVPLGSSMGRNVVTGAQQEWQNFLAQWQQLGVQSIVIPTPGRAAAAGQHDKASSTIECPQENYHDTLAHAQTLEALHVDTTRQLLSRPLVKVGYHLPTAEAAFQAREACAGGVGSNTTEWPRILHWHAISQEAANNPLEFG